MSCSSHTFIIRQGDRSPALSLPVVVGCDETFDEDDYSGWTLILAGPLTLTGTMTFDAATDSAVYEWAAGSTDVPGTYVAMVQATVVATGGTRTFPASGGTEVIIVPLPS